MTYEDLLMAADNEGVIVKELELQSGDGLCRGNRIAIRKDIPTLKKKTDVLAEELGHYYLTVGDILDQRIAGNRKQEQTARLWAYNKLIGLMGIVDSYKNGCRNLHEMADFLNVSEEFLSEALTRYKEKYGIAAKIDNYTIYFEPSLFVFESF